jgi:hypothetical protein
MPLYSFIDNQTGEQFDAFMKISEREGYLSQNPHIQSVVTAAGIVSGVSIVGKVPDGFKEVLSKVAENHKTSAVAEKHGKKSIKQIKTEQLMKKHIG